MSPPEEADAAGNALYRKLPQLGDLLQSASMQQVLQGYPRDLVTEAVRSTLTGIREQLKSDALTSEQLDTAIEQLAAAVSADLQARLRPTLRRVINATGVVLQTNLGRAPLSKAAIQQITEVARGYCNIEMDVDTGLRSRRDEHAEQLILDLLALHSGVPLSTFTTTHAALVVNNCAAATFLALNSLAEGGEVIVSRGELVEIGGGFRIPDILRKSGAVLREVGTTNRTRLRDYSEAITPQTRLILRVHRSNFRIEGFTEQPSLADLIALGFRTAVPVFEDQGTGCIVDLAEFGLRDESSWISSAVSGAALIACSGDKLLGGPQCGLLVGHRSTVDQIRTNPLFRALRVDKLTYAALQATLLAYLSGHTDSIPILSMLRITPEALRVRCEAMAASLGSSAISAEVIPTRNPIGGGTTPGASLPGFAITLQHAHWSEAALAAHLRGCTPPIIGRTSEGRVLLDLRTVAPEDDATIMQSLQSTNEASVA